MYHCHSIRMNKINGIPNCWAYHYNFRHSSFRWPNLSMGTIHINPPFQPFLWFQQPEYLDDWRIPRIGMRPFTTPYHAATEEWRMDKKSLLPSLLTVLKAKTESLLMKLCSKRYFNWLFWTYCALSVIDYNTVPSSKAVCFCSMIDRFFCSPKNLL